MECILGWTKFHNICPLCKIEINILEKFDSVYPDRHERIIVTKPEPYECQDLSDALAFDNGP